jgi:hypothetical protein
MAVDSFKYMDPISRTVMKAWIKRERAVPRDVPWTALDSPLGECRLALLSSAAIALRDDQSFDQDGERSTPCSP